MDLQISAIADYAADYNGKLVLNGAFDTLAARSFPVTHPNCALALRFCLTHEDIGDHKLSISIIDEDGKVIDPKMPIKGDFPVQIPENVAFNTRNLVINLNGLKFEQAGIYSVDINIDEELVSRLPIQVVAVDEKGQPIA